ncbi:hypothetical protein [Terasakiella pusilla]|uniref:hypothetical protein n=1 Tax=Terasakiella pusilla TaxID=64973 RepID=UPI000491C7B8|nr:hypothetical protein [Terasakiella pusilla]
MSHRRFELTDLTQSIIQPLLTQQPMGDMILIKDFDQATDIVKKHDFRRSDKRCFKAFASNDERSV